MFLPFLDELRAAGIPARIKLMTERLYPPTLAGLDDTMREPTRQR